MINICMELQKKTDEIDDVNLSLNIYCYHEGWQNALRWLSSSADTRIEEEQFLENLVKEKITTKKENRIPGIRFAPEVPRSECKNCKLASNGHPMLKSIESTQDSEVSNLLCIKDCLKQKIPLKHNKDSNEYKLLNEDCIQHDMSDGHCPNCRIAYTGHRKGEYSPRLKAVYERSGANGIFVKISNYCPNCKKFFGL